ncbi:MAG: pyridoxal 5'-phosphate synthase glutaminase subunit PdxT [Bacillota bacterium]
MVKIGVLDLQGGVREHLNLLAQVPEVEAHRVKKASEIKQMDGLILPGGESTTISRLLRVFELRDLLVDLVKQGLPIWGTCAGLILLAQDIVGEESHLDLMDITVQRNGYGNQLASFRTRVKIPAVDQSEVPLVFIRAPYIVEVGSAVDVLLELDGRIVAVEEDNMLATSFHPELTDDNRIHNYFADKVKDYVKTRYKTAQ